MEATTSAGFPVVTTAGAVQATSAEDAAAGVNATASYNLNLVYGAEHLATGIDHVLFVVSLTLLVGLTRSLIATITLFTVGHSVTLSLAVLGYVSFPQAVAEVFIALSIVLTAAAVVARNPNTLIAARPWLIAFVFGLLHGLGFAGALAEVGLPQEEIPMSLFAFNVGIELGQLVLIAILVVFMWFARKLTDVSQERWHVIPNYAIGSLAGFWFWERIAGILGM